MIDSDQMVDSACLALSHSGKWQCGTGATHGGPQAQHCYVAQSMLAVVCGTEVCGQFSVRQCMRGN